MESDFRDDDLHPNLKLTGHGLFMQNKDLLKVLGQREENKNSTEKPLITFGIGKYLPFLDDLNPHATLSVSVASPHSTNSTHQTEAKSSASVETSPSGMGLQTIEMDLEIPHQTGPMAPAPELKKSASSPCLVREESGKPSKWFVEKLRSTPSNNTVVQKPKEDLQNVGTSDSKIGQLERALDALLDDNKVNSKDSSEKCKSAPVTPHGSPKNKRKEMQAYSQQVDQVGINRYGRMFRHRATSGGNKDLKVSKDKALSNIEEIDDATTSGACSKPSVQHPPTRDGSVRAKETFTRKFIDWATTSPSKPKSKELHFLAPTSF